MKPVYVMHPDGTQLKFESVASAARYLKRTSINSVRNIKHGYRCNGAMVSYEPIAEYVPPPAKHRRPIKNHIGEEFESLKAAAEALNIPRKTLEWSVKHGKICGGFYWFDIDQPIDLSDKPFYVQDQASGKIVKPRKPARIPREKKPKETPTKTVRKPKEKRVKVVEEQPAKLHYRAHGAVNDDGEYYPSVNEAALAYGVPVEAIKNSIRYNTKAAGHFWFYAKELEGYAS